MINASEIGGFRGSVLPSLASSTSGLTLGTRVVTRLVATQCGPWKR